LRFYAEIRGFFELLASDRRPIAGLTPSPPTPKKAQIEAKGSKPRDSPQVSPGLKNAVKHWLFAISNRRGFLAETPVGSEMKKMTSWSRGDEQSLPQHLPLVGNR
jgi:hypothetical protein